MKMPLIIIGTPSKSWFEPSLALAKSSNGADQDRFRHFFDDNFGSDTHEAPLMGTFSKHAQPQRISKRQMSWSSLSHPSENAVLTDLRAYWLRNALVDPSLNSRVLAFYSAPEDYLANLPGESDTLTALEVWKDAARCILDLIRSHRSRITLFAVEECLASAELFKNLLRQKYSIDAWKIPTQPEADAVRLALGKIQSQSDLEVVSLLAELDAASHPLAGDAPPRIPLQQALEAAWRHLDTGKLQPQAEYRKVLSSLQAIEIKHKESGEENELLLLQLHQVQEELESLHLKSKALEAEVEKANKSQAAAKKEYEEKIQDERKRKQDIEKQLSELKKSLSTAEVRANTLKTTEKKHKETEEENELLLLQLHQVQEELEHYFIEAKRLKFHSRSRVLGMEPTTQIKNLQIRGRHEEGDHCHLDFELEGISQGERSLDRMSLRLVQHHGRAGIVIFQAATDKPPFLYHWQPSGQENQREFMLVIPADDAGATYIAQSTASDLLFIRETLSLLAETLEDTKNSYGSIPWQQVARQFLWETEDYGGRLHYDDIQSKPLEADGVKQNTVIQFSVKNAYLDGLRFPFLTFLWSPAGLLEFQQEQGAAFPFLAWAGKHPKEAVSLDFTGYFLSKETRQKWRNFTGREKNLIKKIAEELPNAVVHLCNQHPKLKNQQASLFKKAILLRRKSQTLR